MIPILFKYRPLQTEQQRAFVEETIVNGTFFFSPDHYFLDPFERSSFRQGVETCTVGSTDHVGTLSLSGTCSDMLMWSFYADWHRGICVGFLPSKECPFFARFKQVQYFEDRVAQDRFLETGLTADLDQRLFKSHRWAHEQEWRIILPGASGLRIEYPREALSRIILGAEITDELRSIVLGWHSRLRHEVQVLQATPSFNTYQLTFNRVK